MLPTTAVILIALVFAATALGLATARALVVAQPDEWLLCIRNGALVRAGVGVQMWRLPGDVVVRFTSTTQRVTFAIEALSHDRLRVCIEGFILWSVSAHGDDPFRAFQRLGLVNLDGPGRDPKNPKHLLTTPQHRAFQQLLGAAVQRLAATRALEDLMLRQDGLVLELRDHLDPFERQMGIRVDQIEVVRARPADDDLLRRMSARVEERVREEAASAHLEATERAKRREREIEREQALAAEARALEVARAVQERQELELAARLARVRREAEAEAEAISLVNLAEEKKSQAVREHELAKLVADKLGTALQHLPIHDARWITVGPDSPAASLAALITAARELTAPGKKAA